MLDLQPMENLPSSRTRLAYWLSLNGSLSLHIIHVWVLKRERIVTSEVSVLERCLYFLCLLRGPELSILSSIRQVGSPLGKNEFLPLNATCEGWPITYGYDYYLVIKLCLTLCEPWAVARRASLPMGFPRQEYWSGLPFPSPGDLPDPGIKPASSALASGFFTTEPPEKPKDMVCLC